MESERFRQVDEIFQSALDRPAESREAFLDEACASDSSMRQEVEALLSSYERAGSFIETPAIEVDAETIAGHSAGLAAGQMIGPYEVLGLLGTGGMGEVYRARDGRLGRKVALKLLPSHLTNGEQRLRRFRQEARAASALNHPNIITIFEIGSSDSINFIATELIDGETLRERLARTGVGVGEALEVATQVASALDAAHRAGIVHRDIKPENVMIRGDGYVKVLDFGLAKLTENRGGQQVDSELSTMDEVSTGAGVVMGTVSYMSPEQARGDDVDARSDIWSLGVVIYEMVGGRRPFDGETPNHTIVSILERAPVRLTSSCKDVPEEFERIVTKMLVKDRDERYQTAKDLLIDLRNLKKRVEAEAGPAQPASSAEYLVSNIKRHKVGALIALVALAIVCAGVAYYVAGGSGTRGKTIDSIAVLPLVNTGGDPNAEYLSDGITDNLINRLSTLPNIRVMSRNSVFRYKVRDPQSNGLDAQEAGRALNVQAVVTGKVTQIGDSLSISIELINTNDNSHVWGEQYNRKFSDILTVQAEIAKDVSEKLRLRLTGEEESRVAKNYTNNVQAYQLYLRGRHEANRFSPDALKIASEYFKQAIAVDPNYALAHAGLARAYSLQANIGIARPREAYQKSKEALGKALALDDTLGEIHSILGTILIFYDWDWAGAEKTVKRAIELNPNDPDSYLLSHYYWEALGQSEEDLRIIKRAHELDPYSSITNVNVGMAHYFARQYDEAITIYQKTLEADQHFLLGYLWLGHAYEQKRMYVEASAQYQKAIELFGRDLRLVASLGHAYAMSGKRREAEQLADELKARASKGYIPPYWIAVIYTGLGDKEKAFEWLENAYNERNHWLLWIKVEPRFDSLRSDPRFTDLLRRIGLPS